MQLKRRLVTLERAAKRRGESRAPVFGADGAISAKQQLDLLCASDWMAKGEILEIYHLASNAAACTPAQWDRIERLGRVLTAKMQKAFAEAGWSAQPFDFRCERPTPAGEAVISA